MSKIDNYLNLRERKNAMHHRAAEVIKSSGKDAVVIEFEGFLVVSTPYNQKFVDLCRKIKEGKKKAAFFDRMYKQWDFALEHKDELLEGMKRIFGCKMEVL